MDISSDSAGLWTGCVVPAKKCFFCKLREKPPSVVPKTSSSF